MCRQNATQRLGEDEREAEEEVHAWHSGGYCSLVLRQLLPCFSLPPSLRPSVRPSVRLSTGHTLHPQKLRMLTLEREREREREREGESFSHRQLGGLL